MTIDFSKYRRIRLTREGRILTLTLNRPEKQNAVDGAMQAELASIFADVNLDTESDVVILTGAGEHFCAGGDIGWLKEVTDPAITPGGPSTIDGKRVVFGLLDLEKPIIAKVRGSCVGLGATIALFCDIIIAAENARIGDPHVRVGLSAGDGGAVIWPQLVGYAKAKELLMTGDLLSAAEAERIGLINHVVPEAELDERVAKLAGRLASGATQAIRFTKVSANIGLKMVAQAVMDASVAYETMTFASTDHHEAVAAFLAKRKPQFTGR
jgi:enoyl-CoA hydratase